MDESHKIRRRSFVQGLGLLAGLSALSAGSATARPPDVDPLRPFQLPSPRWNRFGRPFLSCRAFRVATWIFARHRRCTVSIRTYRRRRRWVTAEWIIWAPPSKLTSISSSQSDMPMTFLRIRLPRMSIRVCTASATSTAHSPHLASPARRSYCTTVRRTSGVDPASGRRFGPRIQEWSCRRQSLVPRSRHGNDAPQRLRRIGRDVFSP